MARKKKGVVVVRNEAGFTRTYRMAETGEVVRLRPGLNVLPGGTVEKLVKTDPRFERQLEESRPGGLSEARPDELDRMVRALEDGSLSINDVTSPYDAQAAIEQIDDIPVLLHLYGECGRVSVRRVIVRKLRRLGYTGE